MNLSSNLITQIAREQPLSAARMEAFYRYLLDCIAEQRLPAAALPAMHEFYDRFQSKREYFLHHFAPFLSDADPIFQVSDRRPHLLDLGCGVGTQAHLFATRGALVTGLDFDPARIAGARAMTPWFADQAGVAALPILFEAADAFQWLGNQQAGVFDGCYTQFALAYMRPHERILHEIDRVVRPGGRLLFREFNAGSLYNRWWTRVDRLSDRAYEQWGSRLGWQLEQRQFHWLFPRQVMRSRRSRSVLGPIEQRLTCTPTFGRPLAVAMTLVFRKQ